MARRTVQSPQERKFIDRYVATGDAQKAAADAGYSQPRSQGYQALARPGVQAEVVRLQQERLFNDVLPMAVDVHLAVLRSSHTPAGAKVQAVKLAYDYAFGDKDAAARKDPAEMTPDEIERELGRLRRVAADKAKLVASVTIVDQVPAQPAGVFD